jgi:hypothetical protein
MTTGSGANKIEAAQLSYATLLVWLVRIGIVGMAALFLPYATGWVSAAIPIGQVPMYWTMDAAHYGRAVGVDAGWGWLGSLADSGVLAFAGTILFPISATVAALAAAAIFLRHRLPVYSGIALAEAAVLVIAATGILV